MISQIMQYCNNHFVRSCERQMFAIVADGITGQFTEKYIVGQYVWITQSFVNDGVYKITGVASNKLTLDAALLEEDTGEYINVFGCAVPKAFLEIVTDIETWNTKNGGNEGVASESIDAYSVSFGNGADGSTANTWQSAFAGRLGTYRQVFENLCAYEYKGGRLYK